MEKLLHGGPGGAPDNDRRRPQGRPWGSGADPLSL